MDDMKLLTYEAPLATAAQLEHANIEMHNYT